MMTQAHKEAVGKLQGQTEGESHVSSAVQTMETSQHSLCTPEMFSSLLSIENKNQAQQ